MQTLATRRPPVEPQRFARKVALAGLLVGVAAVAITQTDYPTRLVFQVMLAVLVAHGTELSHECIHHLATGRGRVDRRLGSILAGVTFVSFAFYQWSHLLHHRYVGTPKDRDSFSDALAGLQSPCRRARIRSLVRHLAMLDHWTAVIRRLGAAAAGRLSEPMVHDHPDMPRAVARKVQRDYRVLGVIAVGSLGAACMGLPLVDLWLVPLAIWSPIHAAIEFPEHYRCESTDNVARNTRSVRAGRLARWLTNFNCHHVGHHLDMRLPFDQLPGFEEKLRSQMAHEDAGYGAFYLRVASDVFKGDSA